MNRLLTLGLLVSCADGVSAGEPVPVLPPASGSLSRSLPSVVNGGLALAPPPVMVSQPTWGTPAPLAPSYQVYPSVQPVPIPQYQAYPTTSCATGCGSRGTLLGRLRTWLCGGPGPAYRMGFVFAPPVAAPQEWTPDYGHITGANGVAGWPGKCDGGRGRLLPSRPSAGGYATGQCASPVGPRPIAIPQFRTGGIQRPNLIRRMWDACVPGGGFSSGGCATGTCATGTCPTGGCAAGTPLLGSLLPSSTPTPYFVSGPVSANPAPAPIPLAAASAAGGYPYAVTSAPASPLVKVNTGPTVPPVPTTVTQPFTQQR